MSIRYRRWTDGMMPQRAARMHRTLQQADIHFPNDEAGKAAFIALPLEEQEQVIATLDKLKDMKARIANAVGVPKHLLG